MPLRRHVSVLSVLLVPAAIACSGGVHEDDAAEAIDQEVSAACGPRYQEAFLLYRDAVLQAKAHLAGQQMCIGDFAFSGANTIWNVTDQASAAVMTCDAFRGVIRDSPWAAPIRALLADSLTLKSLTGELLVIRDSEFQNWTSVDGMIPGTTMYGFDGKTETELRVTFEAEGRARWASMNCEFEMIERPATFTVERTGAERDKRTITITHDGVAEKFLLNVRPALSFAEPSLRQAPEFVLEGLDGSASQLGSIKDECSDPPTPFTCD